MLWLHGSTDLVGLSRVQKDVAGCRNRGRAFRWLTLLLGVCPFGHASVLFGAVDSIAARIGGLRLVRQSVQLLGNAQV